MVNAYIILMFRKMFIAYIYTHSFVKQIVWNFRFFFFSSYFIKLKFPKKNNLTIIILYKKLNLHKLISDENVNFQQVIP